MGSNPTASTMKDPMSLMDAHVKKQRRNDPLRRTLLAADCIVYGAICAGLAPAGAVIAGDWSVQGKVFMTMLFGGIAIGIGGGWYGFRPLFKEFLQEEVFDDD